MQTIEQIPSPPPLLPVVPKPVIEEVEQEEIIPPPVQALPPIVDMLFSHMNGVNQWINRFCISNEGIQNDINTIRVNLCPFFLS